jgi:hypothetical protein
MMIEASGWMLGLLPLTEPALPVERIGNLHPQIYPQEERFLSQSTSWRLPKTPSIYGGLTLSTFPVNSGLLHNERHLSTNYRELSTKYDSGKEPWGNPLPLHVGGILSE